MQTTFLTAEWKKLAIANYATDPGILLPYLPAGTELDFWEGKCYVSLVGFMFLKTRLKGIRIPFHSSFEEVNLRFYVRYRENGTWKRGVTFIREIVPCPALTLVANSIYGEKYITLPMRHEWKEEKKELHISYGWKNKGRWNTLSVKGSPGSEAIPEGSEAEFITEHYWGYTRIGENKTSEYPVEHPRWEIYPVQSYTIDVDFGNQYGIEFGGLQSRQPDSVMLAEGSEIVVRAGKIIFKADPMHSKCQEP